MRGGAQAYAKPTVAVTGARLERLVVVAAMLIAPSPVVTFADPR